MKFHQTDNNENKEETTGLKETIPPELLNDIMMVADLTSNDGDAVSAMNRSRGETAELGDNRRQRI